MSALLQTTDLAVPTSNSPLAFRRAGTGDPGFNRYLMLKGRRAFEIGNICDTCTFLFQRLDGANEKVSPGLGTSLRRGVTNLNDELIGTASQALPEGRYRATLIELTPNLVKPRDPADYFAHEQIELWGVDSFWNLPHDPRTEYYRVASTPPRIGREGALFEFVVPMMPSNWLDPETIARYEMQLSGGGLPAALAISVLDVKQPAVWDGEPTVTAHYCLTHYLLDGHHKMLAAARTQRPLRLLSFLAMDESIATDEHFTEALAAMTPAAV